MTARTHDAHDPLATGHWHWRLGAARVQSARRPLNSAHLPCRPFEPCPRSVNLQRTAYSVECISIVSSRFTCCTLCHAPHPSLILILITPPPEPQHLEPNHGAAGPAPVPGDHRAMRHAPMAPGPQRPAARVKAPRLSSHGVTRVGCAIALAAANLPRKPAAPARRPLRTPVASGVRCVPVP